ncbi:hypothetical protein WDH52_03635 [Streptomyces sp. TRM70308]
MHVPPRFLLIALEGAEAVGELVAGIWVAGVGSADESSEGVEVAQARQGA